MFLHATPGLAAAAVAAAAALRWAGRSKSGKPWVVVVVVFSTGMESVGRGKGTGGREGVDGLTDHATMWDITNEEGRKAAEGVEIYFGDRLVGSETPEMTPPPLSPGVPSTGCRTVHIMRPALLGGGRAPSSRQQRLLLLSR